LDEDEVADVAQAWSEWSLPGLAAPIAEADLRAGSFQSEARPWYERTKRSIDVVIVLAALVVAIPLVILAVAAIRLSSPGPVLFRQTRIGRYGRPFTCYKLRTMVDEAEARLRDPELRRRFAAAYKLKDDPRVTRVGRWLRRTSVDELPQLWNILRGEMSLVGPRPVRAQELGEMYGSLAETVVSVPPGLTGWWQVSGRSDLPYERRVALDVEYAMRRSLLLDMRILLFTPIALLTMRGAV
jgi:exopolysaccharide production protein ExoY